MFILWYTSHANMSWAIIHFVHTSGRSRGGAISEVKGGYASQSERVSLIVKYWRCRMVRKEKVFFVLEGTIISQPDIVTWDVITIKSKHKCQCHGGKRESKRITKFSRINYLGTMDVCTKCCANPFSGCWGISHDKWKLQNFMAIHLMVINILQSDITIPWGIILIIHPHRHILRSVSLNQTSNVFSGRREVKSLVT